MDDDDIGDLFAGFVIAICLILIISYFIVH